MAKIGVDISPLGAADAAVQQIEIQHRPSITHGTNYRGAWANLTAYAEGDSVFFSECYWVAVEANAAAQPDTSPTKWHVISNDAEPWIQNAPQTPSALTLFASPAERGVTYDLRVRYWMADGRVGPWAESQGHVVVGKTEAPADVAGFDGVALGTGQVRLSWSANPDPDIDFYEIRLGGTSWADAVYLKTERGTVSYVGGMAAGPKTFRIKAVDTSGNYSAGAGYKLVNISTSQAGAVSAIFGTANQIATNNAIGDVTLSLTGPHNFVTQSNHGIVLGRGTSPLASLAAVGAGYILGSGASSSADPAWKLLSAGVGIDITIAAGQITITNTGQINPGGAVDSIVGTANQVIVSQPTGNVVLSLPQNIDAAADLAVNSIFASGNFHAFGTDTRLDLYGGAGYNNLVSIEGQIPGLQLYSPVVGINSVLGDIIFGSSSTADDDKRGAVIRGALDAASGTVISGRLEFWTNAAGIWHQALTIKSDASVLVGSLSIPTTAVMGDVFIATGANVMGRLAGVASGAVLASNGVGAAPVYKTLAEGAGIDITVTGSTITITNTGGGGGGAGVTSITGSAHQIIASAPTGAVTLSTPQNIDTDSAVRFATMTLGGALPASTSVSVFPSANNYTGLMIKRFTDAGPSGKFASFQNAAGADLFTIDITGSVTAGTWKGAAVGANYGGTGIAGGYSIGDLIYASGATTLSKRAAVAAGSVLISQGVGVAPIWASTVFVGTKLSVGEASAHPPGGIGQATFQLYSSGASTVIGHVTTASAINTLIGMTAWSTTGTAQADQRAADMYCTLTADSATNPYGRIIFRTANGATVANRLYIGPSRVTIVDNPAGTGDALREGGPIGAITPAAGTFTGVKAGVAGGDAAVSGRFSSDTNTSGLIGGLFSNASGAGAVGTYLVFRQARGTIGSETATQNDDWLGLIDYRGYGTDAWAVGGGARVAARATQAHTNTAKGTRLVFYTNANDAAVLTLALTLEQNQNATFAGTITAPHVTVGSLVLATSAAAGDLLVATGANTMGSIADVAAGQVLTSGGVGVVPAWASSLTLSGDLATNLWERISFTRTIPTVVNDEVDFGHYTLTMGSAVLKVSVVVQIAGFSCSKTYVLALSYNGTANVWKTAVPESDSGAYGGTQNFAVDINIANAIAYLRLRRTAGATAGIAEVVIERVGANADTWTASTATASVAAPTAYFQGLNMRLAGATSGTLLLAAGATTTSWTLTFPEAAPSAGSLVYFSDAAGATDTLPAVAAGQVLVSAGVNTAPAWDSSPYISTGILVGVTGGAAVAVGQFKSQTNIEGTQFLADSATGGAGANYIVMRHARGTIGAETATQLNDHLGNIEFRGYGATGWDTRGPRILAYATEAHTDSASGGQLNFYTVPAGGEVQALALALSDDAKITTGVWNASVIAEAYGGTGQSVYAIGDLLYADGTTSLARRAAVAIGQVLTSAGVGTAPVWAGNVYLSGSHLGLGETSETTLITYGWGAKLDLTSSSAAIPVLQLANTNVTNGTYVGVIFAGSTGCAAADSRTAQIGFKLTADNTTTPSGNIEFHTANAGTITKKMELTSAGILTIGSLTLPTAATMGDIFIATGANAMGRLADVALGQVLQSGGVGQAPAWSSTLSLAAGANGVNLINLKRFTDTVPTGAFLWCQSAAAGDLFGVDIAGHVTVGTWEATAIGAGYGGTGIAGGYTVGDILYASGASALSRLADVAAGSYLRSGGIAGAPVWSTLILPNAATTGDLLMATGANAVGVRAAVALGQVLYSQGTSTAPIYSGAPYLSGTGLGIGGTASEALGLAAPGAKVQVNGAAGVPALHLITSSVAASVSAGYIIFATTGTAQANEAVALIQCLMNDDNTTTPSGYLRFYTADHAVETEKFRIGHLSGAGAETAGSWVTIVPQTAAYLSFSTATAGLPGDDSTGARIQLYGAPGTIAAAAQYNIGVETSYIWNQAPALGGWKLYQSVPLVGVYNTHRMLGNPYYDGVAVNASGDVLTSGRAIGRYAVAYLPSFTTQIKLDTPAAYWKLNETSGNPLDSTANNNDGVAHGAPTYSVAGGILDDSDTAMTFGGAADYITVATSATLPAGDSFTLEFAVKRSATQSAKQYLVCQKAGGFGVFFDATNHLAVEKVGTATIVTSTTTYTSTAVYYYVQVQKDAGNSCRIIVNGVDVSGAVTNQTLAPADGSLWFAVGSGLTGYFPGTLDEISLWASVSTNTALWEHWAEFDAQKLGRIAYATDALATNPVVGGGSGCFAYYTRFGTLAGGGGGYGWCANPLTLNNSALQYAIGDLFYANGVGSVGALADVAVGRVLVSGGVGVAPAWDASVALGVAGTIAGTLSLTSATASSGIVTLASAAAIYTSYTLTFPSGAPAQGALMYFSNATGSLAGLADVATGQVLVSGGVGAAPAYSATPSLTSLTLAAQSIGTIRATSGTPLTPDLSLGRIQVFTHTAAMTINAPTNATSGSIWFLRIANSGASAWSPTFNAAFKCGTIPATWIPAGKSVGLTFYYDGTSHWLMGVGGLSATGPTGGL